MYSGGYTKAEIHLRVVEDGHGILFTTLLPVCCHNLSEGTDYFYRAGFIFFFFLEQAGFYLRYHFTLVELYLTLQMKGIAGNHLKQAA